MKELGQNSLISKTISRRAVLGGIAATAALPAAAAGTCKGYGRPQKSKQYPNDDANVIRANFALWLLLSTGTQFFSINQDTGAIDWSPSMIPLKQALANDLCHLPGKTAADRIQYIQFAIDWLNSGQRSFQVSGVTQQGAPINDVTVSYPSFLRGVRQVFSDMSQGFLGKTGAPTLPEGFAAPYTGHECPGGSREILSIATEKPTALVPQGN